MKSLSDKIWRVECYALVLRAWSHKVADQIWNEVRVPVNHNLLHCIVDNKEMKGILKK